MKYATVILISLICFNFEVKGQNNDSVEVDSLVLNDVHDDSDLFNKVNFVGCSTQMTYESYKILNKTDTAYISYHDNHCLQIEIYKDVICAKYDELLVYKRLNRIISYLEEVKGVKKDNIVIKFAEYTSDLDWETVKVITDNNAGFDISYTDCYDE